MEERRSRTIVVAVAAVTIAATLVVVAAAFVGFSVGEHSGADLDPARAAGAASGRSEAHSELDRTGRARAQREGQRSGYRVAYRRAFRTTKRRAAAGGPHVCGDARTNETPAITKVRAEGVGCAAALEFARGSLSCQDVDAQCQGYSCSSVATGYEEGEMTCRRPGITIRFLSSV